MRIIIDTQYRSIAIRKKNKDTGVYIQYELSFISKYQMPFLMFISLDYENLISPEPLHGKVLFRTGGPWQMHDV